MKKGLAYMARCRGSDGGYGYTSAGGPKPTLTAIGVLCLSLAKEKEGAHHPIFGLGPTSEPPGN